LAVGTVTGGTNGADLVVSFNTADATPTAISTLIEHITYANSSDDPVASRSITFTVDDGDGATGSDTATVNITAVNDPPVNHVPAAQTINEDNTLVFNTANGNLISVTDPDAQAGDETVTLTVNHGTLTLGSLANLTFTVGSGTADATMTFS